jgi:glycosyltransferase involved in cell wall biosynthesis
LVKLRRKLSIVDPDSSWARYHGVVKYEELPAIYKNYDFAIFASSCENLPNIVLETMASGLPLLSSDIGPMPDIIKDGGIYFNPVSIEDIKEKLLEGINNPTRLLNKAIIAKQIALNYSWENTAKETIAYLTEIVDQKALNLE